MFMTNGTIGPESGEGWDALVFRSRDAGRMVQVTMQGGGGGWADTLDEPALWEWRLWN